MALITTENGLELITETGGINLVTEDEGGAVAVDPGNQGYLLRPLQSPLFRLNNF